MSDLIKRNYLPGRIEDRAAWLGNLVAVLNSSGNATLLGVSAAQLDDSEAGAAWYSYLLNTFIPYSQSFGKGLTAFLAELDTDNSPQPLVLSSFEAPDPATPLLATNSGVMNRVTDLVDNTILKSSALSPALRAQLGLNAIVPPAPGDPLIKSYESEPGGHLDLLFVRNGAKMIVVEERRGDQADFLMFDKVAASHCPDPRPNLVPGKSELRQFRIRYSDGVTAYGNYSPVFSANTQA